jgi:hypothetical protein
VSRQYTSAHKTRLKQWLREHPEAVRAWADATNDDEARRVLCHLVQQAGIYSVHTSRLDIPIGGAILELLDSGVSMAELVGEPKE